MHALLLAILQLADRRRQLFGMGVAGYWLGTSYEEGTIL